MTFSKAAFADQTLESNQDRLTPNVWLTRGDTAGLYNIKTESSYDKIKRLSPADTEWAYGTTANYASLTYQTWYNWAAGNPSGTVGLNAVVHLISEDIYLDIKFTTWASTSLGGGEFSYERSTPSSGNAPPSVTLTNPANGGTFVAGTPLTLQATASDSDGSVTNVEFFDGATSLGSTMSGPNYSLTTTQYVGTHLFAVMATDNNGYSTTSAIVTNIGVTVPIADPIAERIPKGSITVELQTIADGMAAPLGMAVPDDGSGRMFVYDQNGLIYMVPANGVRLADPLLDVRNRLVLLGAYDERGLLGLAVHPNFFANPLIYTYTSETNIGGADFQNGLDTTNNHQSVIAEWRIGAGNSNVVDTATRREVLRIDQPQSNHNGGAMHFGPDGMLYVVLGDGGQANDVGAGHIDGGNAQDPNRIWGKMLRIDVDGSNSANGQYGIPADNPFVGTDGLDEVWAYGLRNPFSFSFERGSNMLYLADVGQNKVEEVDIITKGGNYGWNVKEASFWFDGVGAIVTAPVRPVPPGLVDPIAEYDHDDGLAIICGYRYHGAAIAALQTRFVFGDWGSFAAPSGRLFYLDDSNGVKELRIGLEDRPLGMWLRGYGEGPDGEFYIFCSRQLGPTGDTGRILKLIPAPSVTKITSITPAGANVTAAWTGGAGPFALQRKNALTDQTWVNKGITAASSATISQDSGSGFIRVRDAQWQSRIPLSIYMTGVAERPANASAATGFGLLGLEGNTLTFNIAYSGLAATATAAHIHGATNTSGSVGVQIDLSPYNGGSWGTTGTLSGVIVLTDAQKALILAGLSYVNIHDPSFPAGEIRGQIAPVNMQVALSGDNERPTPVVTTGRGLGNLVLIGNQLTFDLAYRNLSSTATAAHIHGPAGVNGSAGVLVSLGAFNGGTWGTSGSLSGSVTLTPDQLASVVDGQTYVNIHTGANPGGEIRGQIVPHVTGTPLTVLLSGLAEKPTPLANSAVGTGTFSLEGFNLTFNLTYAGLSGAATAAHIHGVTNTAGNAGVLIDLAPFNGGSWGSAGTMSGTVTLSPDQRNAMLSGLTYVNFHTTANPGGEMRGQIAPVSMFAALSGNNERSTAIATPATASGSFALVRDQLALVVAYGGLTGPAAASHIHGPATLLGTAGVLVDLAPYNGGAYGAAGALFGTAPLSVSQLLNVIDGSTYVNMHTTANGGGEIRGQIMR